MGLKRSRLRLAYARSMAAVGTVLFLFISFYIRKFDITVRGFDVAGDPLVAYHVARLGFAACLAIACHSLGYWVLSVLRQQLGLRGRKAFVACFFLGASIYGLVFGILGLFQLISGAAALLAVLPALVFARRPLEAVLAAPSFSESAHLDHGGRKDLFLYLVTVGSALLAAVSALLFIATRVIFIPTPDGNVWEHYLHYYRSVLESGSTLPGEVWHHFFASKGGGLIFLSNQLSDVFGAQLVAACMVAAAAVIVFDILSDYCRARAWPFLGLALYFSFFFSDMLTGWNFKVHALILGYAAFLFWGWQQLRSNNLDARRGVLISMCVTLLYIGYYQPVAAIVFAPAFALMTAFRRSAGGRFEIKIAIIFGLIIACGTSFTILLNWVLTGLFDITPIKLLWSIADQEKVRHLFGTGGIDFFLALNNDLDTDKNWIQRIYTTLHFPRLFKSVTLIVGLILFGRAIVRIARRKPLEKPELLLGEIIAFLTPLVLFTVLFPSPSIERMAVYSVVFVILIEILVWRRFVELTVGYLAFNTWFLPQGVREKIVIAFENVSLLAIALLGGLTIVTTEFRDLSQYRTAVAPFVQADVSLQAAMARMEELLPWLALGTTVKAVSEFRASSGYTGALLSLSYDASYAYFLPGRGVVSEPTYALVDNRKDLLGKDAASVAAYLRERNMQYVALNLSSRLFTTLAFTSIFDVQHIQEYFDIAYADRDFFVLRLRDEAAASKNDMPDYLLTALELKRSGVLRFPFTKAFAAALTQGNRVVMTPDEFDMLKRQFSQSLEEIMHAEMLDRMTFNGSKHFLSTVIAAASTAVNRAEPPILLVPLLSRFGKTEFETPERQIRERLVATVRAEIKKVYLSQLGVPQSAILAQRCDERVPFEPDRPSDAVCRVDPD
jgi:hypothetical protein